MPISRVKVAAASVARDVCAAGVLVTCIVPISFYVGYCIFRGMAKAAPARDPSGATTSSP